MFIASVSSDNQTKVSNNTELGLVLVVDDDPRIRRMLARLLSKKGYRVFTAEDAKHAEKLLDSDTFTHVISDYDFGINCPKGTELIPGWRAKYPSIRCALVLTGTPIKQINVPPEVDLVLTKLTSFDRLFAELSRR